MINITEEQAEQLFKEQEAAIDGIDYVLHDETGWEDEGKFQTCYCIYKTPDGKFFGLSVMRSGSYYSDYYYDYGTTLKEVKNADIVVKRWVTV